MQEKKFDNKFIEVVYKVNQVFGKIESKLAIITLWALIVVCVVFISCRFFFHIPTPWADESARYLLILLGWMGAAYAASNNDHLNIDIVGSVVYKHCKNPEKVLGIVDRIAQVMSLVFLLVFLYFYTVFVVKMYRTGTPSSSLPVDMWVPMSLILIGGFLMTVHTICHILLPKKYWRGHLDEVEGKDK